MSHAQVVTITLIILLFALLHSISEKRTNTYILLAFAIGFNLRQLLSLLGWA